jgi:hypothetical protein
MKLIKTMTWTTAFTAGLFLGGVAYSSAQSQSTQPDQNRGRTTQQEPSKTEPASITGELTKVNPQAMTFSVKSASGAEMLFKYDDKTIVTGSETNVAGLATSSGSEVTVSYRNDSAGNMASKIEVHAKR